jgi:predicted metal-dependent hydrolase
MSRKWASCSPTGTVTFSSELLHEPRDFGEAVIVHELIHLIAPNHGRLFRSLYSSFLPNWREVVGDRAVCGAFRG